MSMRVRRSVFGLILAGSLLGLPGTVSSNDQVTSVTGGGWFLFAGSIPMQFGFSAIRHADGSVSGSFHHSYTDGGFSYSYWGRLTCLAVDAADGRAWIGGVLTKVTTDDPDVTTAAGDDAWFRVLDGGTSGDRSTAMGFVGAIPSSAAYCAMQPWPDDNARTHPVTSGQITLHAMPF
jgi:hypothetical protein